MNKYLAFELGELGVGPLASELGLPDWSIDRQCHIPLGTAVLAGSGALQAGSSLAGGKKGASAATSAAQIQAQYLQQALALQKQQFATGQADLAPYMGFGMANIPAVQNFLSGQFSQPIDTSLPSFSYPQFAGQPPPAFTFNPTASQLQNVPGYQFASTQAGNAAVGQLIAQGRYGSGTAMAAADVGNQFAQTDWQNYYNALYQQHQSALQDYQAQLAGYTTNFNTASSAYTTNTQATLAGRQQTLAQNQQILSGLEWPVTVGQGASIAGAGQAATTAQVEGNTLGNIGTTLGSGQVAAANALTGGLTSAGSAIGNTASNITNFSNTQQLLQNQATTNALLANAFGASNSAFNPPISPNTQGTGQIT